MRRMWKLLSWIWLIPLGLWYGYFYMPTAIYSLIQNQIQSPTNFSTLELQRYQVTIEAKPLKEIDKNLSGLTFNSDTGTLWGITNGPSRIIEITKKGNVLRSIRVRGGKDTEGITHLGGNTFMIVDEKSNTLWEVEIDARTTEIQLDKVPYIKLELSPIHRNLGIEALSWSERNHSLWVGQEKWPMRVVELKEQQTPHALHSATNVLPLQPVREWEAQGFLSWLLRDLASMSHLQENGHLLMLSQESRVVAEFTEQGQAVGVLPLWQRMHGLKKSITQAEGITVDQQGTIYIVAEPNFFYRFDKI